MRDNLSRTFLLTHDGSRALFLFEHDARVGQVEHRQIQSRAWLALLGDDELAGDAAACRRGKILYDADTDLRFENDGQQAMLVDGHDKHADFLALLIDAVK